MKSFAAAAILSALSFAGPAAAEPTLAENLAEVDAAAASEGLAEAAGPFSGALGAGDRTRFRFPVLTGVDFLAVAVCDQDCGDLDLLLYNLEGDQLDSDVALDAHPSLGITTETSGIAEVEVVMVQCRLEPCAFTLKVWYRASGW
jgi:hypothetical protein